MLNNLISLYGNGAAAAATSYESIATVTVGAGGSSNISFTSIPSTYKHLQIRQIASSNAAATYDLKLRFNSDTGTNYTTHQLQGNGTAASAYGAGSFAYIMIGMQGAGGATSYMPAGVTDILDYQNTNKYKTVRALQGYDANGSGWINFVSGLWQNTSAITQIDIFPQSGSFVQYSSFALYGVKG